MAPTHSDKVGVTWNPSTGATSYEVWRNIANNSGSATRIASNVATSSNDDTSAVAGTTYYSWIKGVNASGTSGFSNPDSGYAYKGRSDARDEPQKDSKRSGVSLSTLDKRAASLK